MPWRFVIVLFAALAVSDTASGDVYRCTDAAGRVRFVDRADACPGATRYELRARIERVAPADPAPPAAAADVGAASLSQVLAAADRLAIGFDAVPETPVDSRDDPDLVGWGVRERLTRHYTRNRGAAVEVCSVEIWRFSSEDRARLAAAQFSYPGWQIDRGGSLLLMLRGMTRVRGKPSKHIVFPDCAQLGAKVRAAAVWPSGSGG